ncbi:hypothetical protein MWU57_00915 [Isoptericola sp. S6320L]|uniref:hypothetical protein n=1 Tax=Isoptericola sp. S6320L TaxID=2926411 RepID=UPI001FF49D64|nr:hypothetical protein [Isoptericola sp. S6320L]MCK0115585.1 hypothetical protein [Isoptericola sp. S6320L]
MTSNPASGLTSKVTNRSIWILGGGITVIGLALMWASGLAGVNLQWGALLSQCGGALFAAGVITVGWDLLGRRALADEILAKAKLSEDLVRSGVLSVETDFYKGPDWSGLFASGSRLDMFVSWGRTWRTAERSRVEEFMRRGGRMRVFLPDPDDEQTTQMLAARFNMPMDEVQRSITAAVADYRSIDARIEVFLRRGQPMHTFYRFERHAVMAPYNHAGQRRRSVPGFVVAAGTLLEFLDQELESIEEQSRPAP